MSERDPYAEYDAAYLFGALSVEDRAAYESHLRECAECRAGLAALAGLPGLLAQVPLEQVLDSDPAGTAPASLLPRLLTEVARERRRLRLRTGIGALLAAACVIVAIVFALHGDGNGSRTSGAPAPTSSSASSSPTAVVGQPMRVVTATDLRADVAVQRVAWGTRIEMHCTYPDQTESGGPYETGYQLEVVERDGGTSVLARWNAVAGKTLRIEGDSQLDRSRMSRVRVVNPEGVVVLELTL